MSEAEDKIEEVKMPSRTDKARLVESITMIEKILMERSANYQAHVDMLSRLRELYLEIQYYLK